MEKLIELLNEYEKSQLNEFEEYEEWWYCKWNGKILKGNWENNNELTPYELYSKQFGFIKWLVDNDKIDRDKKEIEKSDYDITFTGALTMDKKSDGDIMVDTLLMLLSISDTPIDFLCEILK